MDVTWIGLIAGTLTTSGFVPQIIKSMRTKKTEDVSVFQPLVLLIGMAFWLGYGFILSDPAIILANSVSFILNVWLVILKIKYQYKQISL